MFPFEDCILECIIYVTVSDPYRVEDVGVRLGFPNSDPISDQNM